jgi:hypothetical protein
VGSYLVGILLPGWIVRAYFIHILGEIAMGPHIKWAVMAQLRRGNPSLPPRAKVGTAQRRLDTAFAIAKIAFSGEQNPRDWAALVLLSPPEERGDPMYKDLCRRLARAIWYEKPDELLADCWFHLFTRIDLGAAHGLRPHGWENILPDNATTDPIPLGGISSFRCELLRLASEIDASYALRDDTVVPTPCLTSRAVRLVNKLAGLNLPLPLYRGKEYEGGGGLLQLTLLRYLMLHGCKQQACRIAKHIGKHFVERSMTSGHIYGYCVQGQARPWDTRKEIMRLEIDSRITAGVDQWLLSDVYDALARAIA